MFRYLFLGLVLFVVTSLARAGDVTTTYIYTDQQGTVVAEANAQGSVTSTFDYSPYGIQALGTPPDGPGYTGHVNDPESDLVYMQARYFDPYSGRFLSVDPDDLDPGDIFKISRYTYANNAPTMLTDPTGRESTGEFIDRHAQEASDQGSGLRTYAWAFAGVTWNLLGAEGVSQVADKGTGAGKLNMAMAALEVVTLGKGSLVVKAAEGEGKALAKTGIYWFRDAKTGLPYVGQSSDIAKRIAQHLRSGKLAAADLHTVESAEVAGGKTAREIAEHKKIQSITGGQPARYSDKVANKVDPIGPKRQHLLDEASH